MKTSNQQLTTRYYFDYAAATPMSPAVLKAMEPYFSGRVYNPSAQYLAARAVHKDIEKMRGDVASLLGARPSEVVFTAGGTEANNLAIHGVMQQFPGANCVVSAIEHDSVLEPAKQYGYKSAPVHADGRIDSQEFKKLIDDKTVLVSIMYANNEIGTVQPLSEIARMLGQVRSDRVKKGNKLPLYFHTDACQAPNYLQVLPHRLGADLLTLNGGKIYGPKQSGMLYVKAGTILKPQILGGGQERNMRSGTENVPAIAGFATALNEAIGRREEECRHMAALNDAGMAEIEKMLPSAVVNGSRKYRVPNNLHITIPGTDNEQLMMELDEKGFQVAVGSACSASSDEPSHVLRAIGLSDQDARSSLRISMGRASTEAEFTELIETIARLTKN